MGECSDSCTKPRVLMAIDPGVSTGVAFAVEDTESGEWEYHTATCDHPYQVWDFIQPPVSTVIIERFAAQLISTYGLHTVAVVGGSEAMAHLHNLEYIVQTPQNRRPYLPLARSLVVRPGHTRHEVDAMAQLLCYQYRQGHINSIAPRKK